MSDKKALILTWTGYQDQEVIYPYYRLLGAGFEVDVVSDTADSAGRVYGILGAHVPSTLLYEDFLIDIDPFLQGYQLLVIPGGVKALEKLRLEKDVVEFVRSWCDSGKTIASTCHGAQLLISAGVAKNRVLAGYYSIEDDINNAGGTYSREPVVVDRNVVSSPHYDFMGEWMEAAISSASEPR